MPPEQLARLGVVGGNRRIGSRCPGIDGDDEYAVPPNAGDGFSDAVGVDGVENERIDAEAGQLAQLPALPSKILTGIVDRHCDFEFPGCPPMDRTSAAKNGFVSV